MGERTTARFAALRAALLSMASLAAALSPAARGGEILEVRPIQTDYPTWSLKPTGETIALWRMEGTFDEIVVSVDGGARQRVLAGDTTSSLVGDLEPGERRIEVQGIAAGRVASRKEAPIVVLDAPPVPGVETSGCIFYGYEAVEGGFLEVLWKNRDPAESPYVDFQISVNAILQRVLTAPASQHRFSKVPLGRYQVEVVAFTWNHICTPAVFNCLAEEVEPLEDLRSELARCEDGLGVFRVSYRLPGGPLPEAVGAFDVTEGARYLGIYPAGPPILLHGVEPGRPRLVELVALRGDSASAVPPEPRGEHRVARCELPPGGCADSGSFHRGDCNGDGKLDISDDIFQLGYLFLGGAPPRCGDACDTNDDGRSDISDAIAGLSFKFIAAMEPPPPFPECGHDPTLGPLGCAESTCKN